MGYDDLIQQFLYAEVPVGDFDAVTRFEAISKEVMGTKQRRSGPLPSPEEQVAIREIIKREGPLIFFVPWASRKQVDGMGFDILDFMALRQLRCLQQNLASYGRQSKFYFRLDDLTDIWLFGEESRAQIDDYGSTFCNLAYTILDNVSVRRESAFVSESEFRLRAEAHTIRFYDYLTSPSPTALEDIGWRGTIPRAQMDYYTKAYKVLYPDKDVNEQMSRYFAATLTRVQTTASADPNDPYIKIAFMNPVPGSPINVPQVFYRSIPERYTHQHRAPWLGKGYLRISDDNEVQPRSAGHGERHTYNHNIATYNGIEIQADFVLD